MKPKLQILQSKTHIHYPADKITSKFEVNWAKEAMEYRNLPMAQPSSRTFDLQGAYIFYKEKLISNAL